MDLEPVFIAAHRELRPRSRVPKINVEFFPFAGISHTARLEHERLRIRVCDIFADAPAEICRSLALILLGKLYKTKIDRIHHQTYRTFILRSEMQQRARAARTNRARPRMNRGAAGRLVDLNEVFDRLNNEYFGNALPKPALSWAGVKTRRVLARYDVVSCTIFVSPVFDSHEVPPIVTDYVLFHEMLHLKHESRVRDSRRIVHTPEFKADERRFIRYEAAKRWLASFCGGDL